MFGHCKGPVWKLDDFSHCFQRNFIQTLLPLTVVGVSFLYLTYQLIQRARSSRYYHAYKALNHVGHVWDFRVPANENNGQSPYLDEDVESEDEFDRSARHTLQRTITQDSVRQVHKPSGEVWIVLVEEAAVLAQVGIHVAIFVTGVLGKKGTTAAIAGIVAWSYVAVLATLRLLFSSTARLTFPRLWYHTAFSYGFLWVQSVVLFRSALIHPRSRLQKDFAIADFSLVTALLLIVLGSRKGNKAVELEYEGDLEPSKEQTASVFSLATFSWVDAIVWRGYWKTYELENVWNLPFKDKAATVLADYRQLKKTSILTLHLLRYFRRALILQALWAALSGLLTFVPTLLLKAILEFVERPASTPRNAAWLWVTLLFVSGCASALAEGQALWIGRRICIRLRAVIIGEIYAKALKRRIATGADKILGEGKKDSEENRTKSRLKKAFTFGKKANKAKTTDQDGTKKETNSDSDDSQVTFGAIINLMAVDSFKVAEISAYLHFLWSTTPVQVVLAVYLLYQIMGRSSIAGIGMMVFLLPINLYISKSFTKFQKRILAATDARIHTTNEILTNIRIIKFFAWEQRYMALVDEKRKVELRNLRNRYILWATAATIWSGSPILITFLSFLVYTQVEHKALLPSVAFTALSLFQILRIPLDQLADMVAHVQESKVSVDRIEEYLQEPETDKYKQLKSQKEDESGDPVIGFDDATFSWGPAKSPASEDSAEAFRLIDMNTKFVVNDLNVIVGPTGCGKTSMLMALLGEMTKLKGDVWLPTPTSREDLKPDPDTGLTESVAYCAQQAWLVNGTIKDNILFASPLDSARYKDVIEACSLQRDLEILNNGDQTIVGEKGITLSGGQKQRISLARALYSRARHVLLDDVLSAVDSHTAKWIFDQALLGPLMNSRTCILVTHNVALCLPHARFVVVLDNGKLAAQGSPDEILASGTLGEELSKSRPVSRVPSRIPSRVPSDEAMDKTPKADTPNDWNTNINGAPNGVAKSAQEQQPDEKDGKETKAEGRVKISVIILFLKAMGTWRYWLLSVVCFGLQQIASVGTNVWIREWARAYDERRTEAEGIHSYSSVDRIGVMSPLGSCIRSGTCVWPMPAVSHDKNSLSSWTVSDKRVNAAYYLEVYAALGIFFMAITWIREMVLFSGSLHASRRIHSRLMDAVCHAKFRFFDSTPLGQIMNRFSKDIEAIDQEVAPAADGVIHCLASILTIVVLISVFFPGFLIAAVFITILYYLIGRFYLSSSVDLKRLESVQRSPLYQQFGETLSGMTTIRAYGDERRFIRDNLAKVNTHNRPFIYLWAANRWLAFRVDVVGALVSFCAGAFVILSVGRIDASAAGLALTYAVSFTENVLWFVRLYSSNEQNMNSVERVKEYLDVDQEAAPIIADNRPPGNWPSKGGVEFIAYSTRYRKDFDLVLKNITLKIEPGEKIGVVGRTGAGKSSLALALFRALEAEEGKILVDDVDIGLIGLQDLRENIVMVPQDPTLFTGTIRSNLDPFGLFTDEEIFTALRRVQLIGSTLPTPITSRPTSPVKEARARRTSNPTLIRTTSTTTRDAIIDMPIDMPAGSSEPESSATAVSSSDNKNSFLSLSSTVTESGSNLSQGQRQLLCLARALLKNPKVLLMDEATASIDYATDAKIQETIREIKNTTITIAHRLQTIVDYDKVLVLDHGKVVEYGSPWELLQASKKSNANGSPESSVDSETTGGFVKVGRNEGFFRGMCEMSGEMETLEREARKAWEKKRLVDDGT